MLRYPSPAPQSSTLSNSVASIAAEKPGRALLIKTKTAEVSLYVPLELWPTAERVRDQFRSDNQPDDDSLNELELSAKFMKYASEFSATLEVSLRVLPFLRSIFSEFRSRYLRGNDPHAVIKDHAGHFSVRELLRIYYDVFVLLKTHNLLTSEELRHPPPALFSEVMKGNAQIIAIFGGQGNTEDLLHELGEIYNTYAALIEPFLGHLAATLAMAAEDPEAKNFVSKGLDIMKWLERPETRPSTDYLIAAPISLPLVGLIQLLNYCVAFKSLSVTPGQLKSMFVGATGHSQGIVSAVVLSASVTEDDFLDNSRKALHLLFWIGLRAQQVYPQTTLNPKILSDSLAHGEGIPTPMLAISSLSHAELENQVQSLNKYLSADKKIEISLMNGPRSFVCSGPPQSLYGLNLSLRKLKALPSVDQSRVPFSERKLKFSTKFLPISTPFHCSFQRNAVPMILADIDRYNLHINPKLMDVPVFSTDNGTDVRQVPELMKYLVEQICSLSVHWVTALGSLQATHILDFGPGHASGIGALTHKIKDGSGIQILLAGSLESPSQHLQTRCHLFDCDEASLRYGPNWKLEYQPKLVRNKGDGKVYVDTRFSRLLGKPPVMVAGMTPSSVNEPFVSACINAGYHVELAGGGHFTESALREKVEAIVNNVAPGQGITLNVLFINQRQWGFQYPLAQLLRREGYPIEGFTVAAGVPSLEVANDIITSLTDVGIRHVSFKPGSVESIVQVVNIARSNPNLPIILQWTGGRAGGHHSYEDLHQPILETYALIRSQTNIFLVAGSGFGDGDGTYPYLTGDWSLQYDYPAMPFDGVLFGSRLLVAKEGRASRSVKETIAAASGLESERDWVKSYKGPIGGVVTVKSELGEPIHKIATKAVLFWKELDDTIFNLPKDKRLEAITTKRDYIIGKLNSDHQKVWFGRKFDGRVVDLAEMTYGEISHRLIDLLFVSDQGRWIDLTYRSLVLDFLRRMEERQIYKPSVSLIQSADSLSINPRDVLLEFYAAYPDLKNHLVNSEDIVYFLSLCQRPGQKPVPFVPLLDENFEFWFKKDSLWQAEDIDAVVDRDPQRVCILQGPVAAKYSKVIDEPVKSILDSISGRHIDLILRDYYGSDCKRIPEIEWFGGPIVKFPFELARQLGMQVSMTESSKYRRVVLPSLESGLPSPCEWLELLGGEKESWIRALLKSRWIIQNRSVLANPVRELFRPRSEQEVQMRYDLYDNPIELVVHDRNLFHGKSIMALRAHLDGDIIHVEVKYEKTKSDFVSLFMQYRFVPSNAYALLHEMMEGRNERIKQFYWKVWFGNNSEEEFHRVLNLDVRQSSISCSSIVEREDVNSFCRIVGNQAALYMDYGQKTLTAPMDFAIIIAWKAVCKCLFPRMIDGDLLKLVHLSNRIVNLQPQRPIQSGDQLRTEAKVTSLVNTGSGKIIEIAAIAHRHGEPVLKVVTRFLFRGKYTDDQCAFERKEEIPMQYTLATDVDVTVLKSKSWFTILCYPEDIKAGSVLKFRLTTVQEPVEGSHKLRKLRVSGEVHMKMCTKEYAHVADVEYEAPHLVHGNPVLDFLKRRAIPIEQSFYFENDGYVMVRDVKAAVGLGVTSSASNHSYSDISGDFNPIHTSPYFADLVSLPGTITHGMWTSAAVRAQVETYASDNQPLRVTDYEVTFADMVLPDDRLETKMRHVGMKNGRKLVRIETFNQRQSKVLEGLAEVEQPVTAYVFTGQGSQEVGMGMDLYKTSPVAQQIWDNADRHFTSNYGFSILEIVRHNPKQKTIHFGGPKGMRIRHNYQSMTYEVVTDEGQIVSRPLFPNITSDTDSFTFASPNGLLYATQFTQPALTLMEKAAFEDMRVKGLVSPNCAFAGHSLGEYAALASIGDVLTIDTLCDVVFYRGMTMQVAVRRDEQGRSGYGMCAVNPSRVDRTFNDQALRHVVGKITSHNKRLLEIVNYNVENWQYVVAGELWNLDILTQVLNYLGSKTIDFGKFVKEQGLERTDEFLASVIEEVTKATQAKLAKDGHINVERGLATIPLAGIDVPFHSSFLLSGVVPFRAYIDKKISPTFIDVEGLRGKYIPNLTAEPFNTTWEYIKRTHEVCNSPKLAQILNNWSDSKYQTAAQQQSLAHALLVEVLAYQFASPVRWIESQDRLFLDFAVERLIEIGPSPTLSNMAERTLKFKYEAYDDALNYRRVIWCYSKHRSEIYFETDLAAKEEPAQPSPRSSQAQSSPRKEERAAPPRMAGSKKAKGMQRIEDLPLDAEDLIQVLIAHKLKRPLEDVPTSKSIRDISGGKSTQQNELLSDLQKEFGGDHIPEKSEELSVKELAGFLNATYPKAPGKHSTAVINKMFTSKMPAGFSVAAAKGYLDQEFGLSAKASDTILAFTLHAEPEARLESEEAAKAWLKAIAKKYFDSHGIQIVAETGPEDQVQSLISSAELEAIQEKHRSLIRQQIELFAAYVGQNLHELHGVVTLKSNEITRLQHELDLWLVEHGQAYSEGIQPMFSALKARKYDSYWNWVRQDVLLLYYDIVFGRLKNVDRDVASKCFHVMNRAYPELVEFMEYRLAQLPSFLDISANYVLAKQYSEELIHNVKSFMTVHPVYKDITPIMRPQTKVLDDGKIGYEEIRREGANSFEAYVHQMKAGSSVSGVMHPFLYLCDRCEANPEHWTFSQTLTCKLYETLGDMAINGVSFDSKYVLITGCGRGSIGGDVLKGLLSGGAKVVATTSSFSRSTAEYFREIYETHGARSSCLVVVPFNQGSMEDVKALVDYIYSTDSNRGLGWDLDFILPFAAVSENGRSLSDIDSKSELAHRLMMTNLMRLLGSVIKHKEKLHIHIRPAQVLLPLSSNHGVLGFDGLYGESKASLETLLNRWHSEDWRDYLSIVGCVIGWTRGTGLMNDNNLIADQVEAAGVRTFSTHEMAFNILGLLHPSIARLAQNSPVYADFGGGMNSVPSLNEKIKGFRDDLGRKSVLRKALNDERILENSLTHGKIAEPVQVTPRSNLKFSYYPVKPYEELKVNPALRELLDLGKVVVVTGFGEVGPWGNSRTRWEMEADGEFSLEGCIEMAWIMGFIQFKSGVAKSGKPFSGWIDCETLELVPDFEIKARYEKRILQHSGVRLIEPKLFDDYDPNRKHSCQEVAIDFDMQPLEVSKEEADHYKHFHGDKVDVYEKAVGQWAVKFKKGSTLYIPKALRFDRLVAGQIPSNWSAARYGVPKDIIDQVDPITLYVLVSTVEALVAAGITDPYEFYQYVHLAEVGNTSGGGVGGMASNRKIFKGRFLDKPIQHDILQESFINTMPAWINLLLLSSSGPIKTPVGACATAVESVEIGVDTIKSGKARVVIVGGYDDLQEEGSYEFASMKATSNAVEEMARGREPNEMSRPTTSSRSGFMESHGAGIEILMAADLAIQMGCPIYGIIALTNTATDKEGRSIPAPGQGILTTARHVKNEASIRPRILDINYRLGQARSGREAIRSWVEQEVRDLHEVTSMMEDSIARAQFLEVRTKDIELEACRRESHERQQWGMEFYSRDPRISSIEGALAVYGLTVDDIGVASFHGTGTKANDINESEVVNKQMAHLGRTRGNLLPSIFQKYLTGHPKGAAAAWMLNGMLQTLNTGIIPGNRNADNIDERLMDYSYLLYPSRPIHTDGLKAGLLKSFGFGQVGGEVLVVHPDHVLGALTKDEYEAYRRKREQRQAKTLRYLYDSLIGVSGMVQVKSAPPFSDELESAVYLNPLARAQFDKVKGTWIFGKESPLAKPHSNLHATIGTMLEAMAGSAAATGVGVDVQYVSEINIDNDNFIQGNFTHDEIKYCHSQPDVRASFAGRWSAKEATVKALCNVRKDGSRPAWLAGAGSPLNLIEVIPDAATKAPHIVLHGQLAADPVKAVQVSISHSGDYAVAIAVAIAK